MTFAEAAELLGRRYGVAPQSPEASGQQRRKERLFEMHEQACELFQQWLAPARAARDISPAAASPRR